MNIKNILKSKNFWLYLLMMLLGTAVVVLPVVLNLFNFKEHWFVYCFGLFISIVADVFYSKAEYYLENEKKGVNDDSI